MSDNKVAIITGSSTGIGKACSLELAKSGYNIVLNYNVSEEETKLCAEEIKKIGSKVLICKADVSSEIEVKEMVDKVMGKFGRIDLLINNAGVFSNDYFVKAKAVDLGKMIDVNIKGCFYCSKEVIKKMIGKSNGKIINISSISSLKAFHGQSIYSMTKGAINSITRTMAKEVIPFGIQVNAIAPGFIATKMTSSLPEKYKTEVMNDIPAKRFGTVEEVAQLVSFLASDLSNYIVGQVISIDGGFSI